MESLDETSVRDDHEVNSDQAKSGSDKHDRYAEARVRRFGTSVMPLKFKKSRDFVVTKIGRCVALSDTLASVLEIAKSYEADARRLASLMTIALDDSVDHSSPDHAAVVAEMKLLKAKLAANELHKSLTCGILSWPMGELEVVLDPLIRSSSVAETKVDEGPGRPARPPASLVKAWLKERAAEIGRPPRGDSFRISRYGVSGPIYKNSFYATEGRVVDGRVVSAYGERPRTDEPVELFTGVPGGGKTHSALASVNNEPKVVAFGPTVGSREQMRALAGKTELGDRLEVVGDVEALASAKVVVIDEAGRVGPNVLDFMKKVDRLVLAGDVGQSQVAPGGSILGMFAALGAPMRVLTTSQRTTSPGIQLLSQFVSATLSPAVPSTERVIFEEAVDLQPTLVDGEIERVLYIAERNPDVIAITFRDEMKERLRKEGIRAFLNDEAQGVEADFAVAVVERDWLDPGKWPDLPFITLINGLCRARKKGFLVTGAWAAVLDAAEIEHPERARDIREAFNLLCADPRALRKSSFDYWPALHWRAAFAVQSHFSRLSYGVDRIGDCLLIYSKTALRRYIGAVVIEPAVMTFDPEAFAEKGFAFATTINAGDRIFDQPGSEVMAWLGDTLGPLVRKAAEPNRSIRLRNDIAAVATT